jgi:hypothetical protein
VRQKNFAVDKITNRMGLRIFYYVNRAHVIVQKPKDNFNEIHFQMWAIVYKM